MTRESRRRSHISVRSVMQQGQRTESIEYFILSSMVFGVARPHDPVRATRNK